MTYLVDSDWIVDCLRGNENAIRTLAELAKEGLSVSIISVAEIYEGAYGQPETETHLASFRTFLRAFTVLTLDDAVVHRFAQVRSKLRRQGLLIADFDLLIGATALVHDLTVLTRNVRDFERIKGLKLYQQHP